MMKDNYPRLIPVWFLVVIVVAVVLLCSCVTGGRSLNTESSGIKRVITPSSPSQQDERSSDKSPILKIEPLPPPKIIHKPITPKAPVLTPVPPPPPESTIIEQPITKTPPRKEEKLTPITPAPITPLMPTDIQVVLEEEVVVKEEENIAIKEEDSVKINWSELIMFYGTALMLLCTAIMVYQITKKKKGSKNARKKIRRRNNKKT